MLPWQRCCLSLHALQQRHVANTLERKNKGRRKRGSSPLNRCKCLSLFVFFLFFFCFFIFHSSALRDPSCEFARGVIKSVTIVPPCCHRDFIQPVSTCGSRKVRLLLERLLIKDGTSVTVETEEPLSEMDPFYYRPPSAKTQPEHAFRYRILIIHIMEL